MSRALNGHSRPSQVTDVYSVECRQSCIYLSGSQQGASWASLVWGMKGQGLSGTCWDRGSREGSTEKAAVFGVSSRMHVWREGGKVEALQTSFLGLRHVHQQ